EKEEEKKKGEEENDEEEKEDEEDKEQLLDGIPESFIGPLLADLVAHEVGHTIGLRHNFKSSAVYTMEEINSETFRDKKPFAGSVMDYLPVNINVETGEVQGDYAMREIGPYDHWAVEYGYTSASDLTPILSRVAEPELAYATDEDTWGPDPYARRYDFSRDPLTYAQNQMRLVRKNRAVILDQFVEDGESWARARRGYELTLNEQVRAVGMMANWVGGAFVYRDKKGDPNGRAPIEVVPAEKQREALDFVMEHSFRDKAFGLTPDLLRHMTVDKWWDNGGSRGPSIMEDPAWPIHDRVLGIQAAVLTALMKPSTLERVYDNEFLVPEEEDALTLPELLDRLHEGIWGDVLPEQTEGKAYSARSPMISSLRRNLQKEYVDRLIELLGEDTGLSVAEKPVQDLAAMQLERIYEEADAVKELPLLDPYSRAHLMETGKRIQKVLDAAYVRDLSDGGLPFPFFLRQ
ncbi:MAG: zinc-dependent metalloprotease, partial [Verrucomicrobiota bacterium]